MTSLRIQERFVSVQGEGMLVGTPSSFVRVSGCNLRCAWCDTPESSWSPTGTRISLDELVLGCAAGPKHVVLTGGEPLLFPQSQLLVERLRARGHHVTVETAGTVRRPELRCDLMSMSPKLRHSAPARLDIAQRHNARRWNPDIARSLLAQAWQLKFVVRTELESNLLDDIEEVRGMLRELDLPMDERVFLMPEGIEPARLPQQYAKLSALASVYGFRVGMRMHLTAFGHAPGT